MLRKIIALIISAIVIAGSAINCYASTKSPASPVSQEYTPGPIQTVLGVSKPISADGCTTEDSSITIPSGKTAKYDVFFDANQVKAEITYSLVAFRSATLTLKSGSRSYSASISPLKSTVTIDVEFSKGSHELHIFADNKVKISDVTFTKEAQNTGMLNTMIVDYNDYEEALQSAVVIHKNSVAIKVKGAMRYIDYNDTSSKPYEENEKTYLPINTVSKAFSLYCEDYNDLDFVYLSNDFFEFFSSDTGEYAIVNGVRKNTSKVVIKNNGKTYVSVTDIAELIGLDSGKTEDFVIIDDRILLSNIISNEDILTSLETEFAEFNIENLSKGTVYHVSKSANASDDNTGSEESPFFTINRAAQEASAGDTVIIHEGIYREEVIPQNDGTAVNPIVFKAAEGENVTISAFDEHKGQYTLYDETKNIYSTPAQSIGFDRNFIISDDEILREGRHPNSDTSKTIRPHPDYTDDVMRATMGNIRIVEGNKRAESTTDLNQADGYWKGGTFVSLCGYGWTLSHALITDSTKGSITLEDTAPNAFGITFYAEKYENDYGYITNHINTVDMPGEWFLDDSTDTLYIIPPQGKTVDNLQIEIKARQRVVDLTDKEYVQFVNINTRGGGITMSGNSRMCVVNGGTHKYISHVGISTAPSPNIMRFYDVDNVDKGVSDAPEFGEVGFYAYGTNNAFINTNIDYSAGAGLYITGKYAYLENNTVSHTGYAGVYASGIFLHRRNGIGLPTDPVGGHTVVCNTVYGTGRAAFFVGSGTTWTEDYVYESEKATLPYIACDIGYNHFYNANVTSRDSGVIYTYGVTAGNDRVRTKIHHNVVHDNITEEKNSTLTTLIYIDGNSAMFDVYNNIMWTSNDDYLRAYDKGVYVQSTARNAQAEVWNNNMLGLYDGNISTINGYEYPSSMPFRAGAINSESQRFMSNYNRMKNDNKIYAYDAVITGEGYIDENGFARLQNNDSTIDFSEVALFEGGTCLEVYYTCDFYGFDYNNVEVMKITGKLNNEELFNLERGLYKLTSYEGNILKERFYIDSKDDVSAILSLNIKGNNTNARIVGISTYKCNYGEMYEKADFPFDANVIYMGSYDENPANYGGQKDFVNSDMIVDTNTHYSISKTDTCLLIFKNRNFSEDVNHVAFRFDTSIDYGNTTVEVRIDSETAEPVVVFDIADCFKYGTHHIGDWKTFILKTELDEIISKGIHNLYISYKTNEEVYDYSALNSYYMAFYNESELIYDMDLSEYKDKGRIKNSAGKGIEYFALTDNGTGSVNSGVMTNVKGDDVPYIQMASSTNKLTYQTADLDRLGGSYTLEAWIQPERLNNTFVGQPFMSINSDKGNALPNDDLSSQTNSTPNVAVGFVGSSNVFYEDTGDCAAYIAWHRTDNWSYSTNWMHQNYRKGDWIKVTLVREVIKGETEDTIKKRLYINGTHKINGYTSNYWNEWSYTAPAPFNDEILSFNIGSYDFAYDKFNIADVKLYNDVRTPEEISADYSAEKGIFTPVFEDNLEEYLYYQTDLESYNPPTGENGEVHTGYISNALEGSEGLPYLRQQGLNGVNRYTKEFVGIGHNLKPIYRAVNDRMTVDKYVLKDADLAGEDILVSAWFNWGVANVEHYNVNFLTVTGWDAENNEVNQANLMIGGGGVGWGTPLWKYGNTAVTWDTTDSDNSEKLVHLAIIRDVEDGGITNYYYRDGILVATEVLPDKYEETSAGIELCPGYRRYLHTYDVKIYTGKDFDSKDIEIIYNKEKGSFEMPMFTLSSDCVIADKSGAPITNSAQLADGFKFSAKVTGNGMANAVVALYKDKRLCDIKIVDYNMETEIGATFDAFRYNPEAEYSIKLMLLSRLSELYPMSSAMEYPDIFGG